MDDVRNREDRVIAIAATFTIDPLEPVLDRWTQRLGFPAEIRLAPYSQVFQQITDPGSDFGRSRNGCAVVLLRFEDWPSGDEGVRTVEEFVAAVKRFDQRAAIPLVVVICPPSAEARGVAGTEHAKFERMLRAGLHDLVGVSLAGSDAWTGEDGEYDDPVRYELAGIPYTRAGYVALGTVIARAVHAQWATPYKVLVLDCDNTLWRGVCGEDGPDGVAVDDGHRHLQEWAVDRQRHGTLLCLCSKNAEDDVDAVFTRHGDMPLCAEHIVARRVNWQSKADNILSLATELDLGLDSFVFIDDNPLEVAAVQAAHPAVLALTLPDNQEEIPRFLRRLWAFDRPATTREDRQRTAMYRAKLDREQLRGATGTFADFIAGLELTVEVREAGEGDLARVAQLTQRTNQFNLNPAPRSQPELRAMLASGARCLVAEVADRFGDYGLVGVAITTIRDDTVVLDTFLLSCRVLGRGVEHAFLAAIAKSSAGAPGMTTLEAKYSATPKNTPARLFFDAAFGTANGSSPYRASLGNVAELVFRPETEVAEPPASTPRSVPDDDHGVRRNTLAMLAMRLNGTQEIEAFLGIAERRAVAVEKHGATSTSASWTDSWKTVRDVIGRMRDVPVSAETTLESLRLTSLEIVDAFAELRRHGENLDLTVFFEHRTLGEIAGAIAGVPRPGPVEVSSPVPHAKPRTAVEGVAVVGAAGRYPGASDLEQLWRNLLAGVDSVGDAAHRWGGKEHVDPDGGPDKTYTSAAGLIEGVDEFDSLFFNIAPSEAETMDPQQRLFLQCAYHALEDAGHTTAHLGHEVGVYVASMGPDYAVLSAQAALHGRSRYPNYDIYQIANRVSHFFDFRGPSIAIDTACSGSGVALQLAFDAITAGTVSAALVGGVNLILHPARRIQYAQLGMLSPTGRCRPFGADADGMISSEAVGALLLRPLSDALADGDHIYGVIKAVGTNNDGRTNGFTVPNPEAQAELISSTLRRAGIDPVTIGYVEAHGTGTPLGDPIEIRGLTTAFGRSGSDRRLPVGSVKSNIGHTEAAACIAGLTKTLLQLRRGTLVPSLHADRLNPHIDFEHSPFQVQREVTEWPARPGEPRRASLNSFGAGGVNVHVVVEEGPPPAEPAGEQDRSRPDLVVLSAPDDELLLDTCSRLARYLREADTLPELSDVAHTLRVGRNAFEHRIALVVENTSQLSDVLERLAAEPAASLEKAVAENELFSYGRVGITSPIAQAFEGSPAAGTMLRELGGSGDLWRIGALWTQGVHCQWQEILGTPGHRVSLPGFPFRRSRHWLPETPAPSSGGNGAATVGETAADRPRAARAGLHAWLRSEAADLAGIPTDEIDDDVDLSTYGFNSLLYLDFAKLIREELGKEPGVSVLVKTGTITALAELLRHDPEPPTTPDLSAKRVRTCLVLTGVDAGLRLVEELAGPDEIRWVVLRQRSALPMLADHQYEVDFADYVSAGRTAKEIIGRHGPFDAVADLLGAGPATDLMAGRVAVLTEMLAAHDGARTLHLGYLAGGPGTPAVDALLATAGKAHETIQPLAVDGATKGVAESVSTVLRRIAVESGSEPR